jgi:hypothetical protein
MVFIDSLKLFELYGLEILAVTNLLLLRKLPSTFTNIRPNSGNSFHDAAGNHPDVAILPEILLGRGNAKYYFQNCHHRFVTDFVGA